jgi:uncharacterized protein YchJ
MNVNTGKLRRFSENESEIIRKMFTSVPEHLEEEANSYLGDKDSVIVDMEKQTPLTAWATGIKQGRNNKCSCGSGKKYKHCCGK